MLKLSVLDARQELKMDEFAALILLVSEEKRNRIEKNYKYRNSQNSLLGDILARKMIAECTGISPSEQKFSLNSHGKPFLDNDRDIHHNISHSGSWVVCGISNRPVGVDVQEIKPIDSAIAKRFFSGDEYEYIMEPPTEERDRRFYRIWSMKESYIKQKGGGLSIPLASFSVLKMLKSSEIKFYHLDIHPTVDCHICTVCDEDSFNRTDLTVVDILGQK